MSQWVKGLAPSYLSDFIKVKQRSSYLLHSKKSLLLEVSLEQMFRVQALARDIVLCS